MKKYMKWGLTTLALVFLTACGHRGMHGHHESMHHNREREERYETETNIDALDKMREENKNPLPIPELLENKSEVEGQAEFDLKVQNGTYEFIEGYEAETLGYNGDYLGPIIKVNRGDHVKINVDNELAEETTVHWHGLAIPGEIDGGPHQVIEPKGNWQPEFTVDQPAATAWFHPHVMGITGLQVYKGLAGLFYIEDEVSKDLPIPKEHGVNDIPLIVQDKRFTEGGQIPYDLNMMDLMDGFMGDTVLVNGAIEPVLVVRSELVRFRLLNGSNARDYEFSFEGNETFYQIASDGGFLEESLEMDHLELAPGERAEILVDFSGYADNDQLAFRDEYGDLMQIEVVETDDKQKADVPKELVDIEDYDENDVVRSREFMMSGMGRMVAINGKQMDMDRIDEEVKLGELEEWVIKNDPSVMGGMGHMRNRRRRSENNRRGMHMGMGADVPHPFHIHGTQFRVIERNGETPPENEQGWKDTVMLRADEEVKVLVKFDVEGLFMYHCHILEHEDSGMMGQFSVK